MIHKQKLKDAMLFFIFLFYTCAQFKLDFMTQFYGNFFNWLFSVVKGVGMQNYTLNL